jgi:hypothetical protein
VKARNPYGNSCPSCGGQPVRKPIGRPLTYCSSACRQAAGSSHPGPAAGPDALDSTTRAIAHDLGDGIPEILRMLRDGEPPLALVERTVRLSRLLEALTAGLVGQARRERVQWKDLGRALAMSPENARRAYQSDAVRRRLQGAPLSVPLQARLDGKRPAPRTGAGALAQVLSGLWAASGLPLPDLARAVRLTVGEARDVLSGERFPSWAVTAQFGRVLRADTEVLRRVWEDGRRRVQSGS